MILRILIESLCDINLHENIALLGSLAQSKMGLLASLRSSVCPHELALLPLDRFP